jgi:hypothetical protein
MVLTNQASILGRNPWKHSLPRVSADICDGARRAAGRLSRRFVNVRFVSKVDLRQMIQVAGNMRHEPGQEIRIYLASLKG